MQGCFEGDTPAVKAILGALDYTVEEEANWACKLVAGSYPSRRDLMGLLLSKLCSDGDVGLALGKLQMHYDDEGDMQGLFRSLLLRLPSFSGEMFCIANGLWICTPGSQSGLHVTKL